MGVVFAEILKSLRKIQRYALPRLEARVGAAHEVWNYAVYRAEIAPVVGKIAQGVELVPMQEARLAQLGVVYEVYVARERGKRLVGGVPVARGAEGTNLPVRKTRAVEELYKRVGGGTYVANAVRRRQDTCKNTPALRPSVQL